MTRGKSVSVECVYFVIYIYIEHNSIDISNAYIHFFSYCFYFKEKKDVESTEIFGVLI